ncbi:hypothetical protein [Nocardiopsis trehalosi]|jgi:hypothetical protein|uniref:hypothetical protein n=1 Tax=Nocardiopsis trehalosi TaxID=109329 RepID=UPI0008371254|nr:hypothetical protein [Nocardiopsis trehalosi]
MRPIRSALQGAAAGVAATTLMTGVMSAAKKAGAMGQDPPKLLVRRLLPGGHQALPRTGEDPASAAAHLAFGAGAGAVFGVLTGRRRPGIPTGVGYALLVWAASYEGWVPALRVQPPAHRDAPGRTLTMAAAHVVYGAALARTLRAMRARAARKDAATSGNIVH